MIVRKKNPEWFPSENKGLKMGETIDITDPKQLIIAGDVVGVSDDGVELSAYDLYGVLVKDELEEFKAFKEMKQQEGLKSQLEKDKAELEAKLAASKPEEKKEVVEEVKPETTPAVKPATKK